MGKSNSIKIPLEIYEEITGTGDLYAWVQQKEIQKALILNETVDEKLLKQVIYQGYAPDLTDDEVETIGRDPFLIAYAIKNKHRCVVTSEVSKPKKERANRKIPDVCKSMGVSCYTPFELNRKLGFCTDWKVKSL